jgi:hypothetical protein
MQMSFDLPSSLIRMSPCLQYGILPNLLAQGIKSMKTILRMFFLWAFLLLPALSAQAYDFQSGMDAYRSGDFKFAHNIFSKLAEVNYDKAQFMLGAMYGSGQGVKKDLEASRMWFSKAAEQGHPAAQANLGLIYSNGMGVESDDAEAAKWFTKAAEQNYAPAQSTLGLMYYKGAGVEQDKVKALSWLMMSVHYGDKNAGRFLELVKGKMSEEEVDKSIKIAEAHIKGNMKDKAAAE